MAQVWQIGTVCRLYKPKRVNAPRFTVYAPDRSRWSARGESAARPVRKPTTVELEANDDLEARPGANVLRNAPPTMVRKPTLVELEAKEYGH